MTGYDAIVVGAGYCGTKLALHLRARGFKRVALIDRAGRILSRASRWNQARVHRGYHYPRALTTAAACGRSYQRFVDDNADAVLRGPASLYAIVRGSRVSAVQFEQFCRAIGAPLHAPPQAIGRLFDSELVEAVYLADEMSFNVTALVTRLEQELQAAGVDVMLNRTVAQIDAAGVHLRGEVLSGDLIFNCTYAALDTLGLKLKAELRKEWAEMALITPPAEIAELGVTVMDGPFFSMLPFAALGAYTLSHVRFTPVAAWKGGEPAPAAAIEYGLGSPQNAVGMVRDASRYLPVMRDARVHGSIFETKAILSYNDDNDGRPILIEESDAVPGAYSILSGKIDNVYDILDRVDEILEERSASTLPRVSRMGTRH